MSSTLTAATRLAYARLGYFVRSNLWQPPWSAAVGELGRSLRHEVAFGTAWLDASPDQALRVAAGFHGSMRLSGWGRVAPTGRGVKPSR